MIIFVNILLDKGVISSATFTATLLMAVASTMLTVPMATPLLQRHKSVAFKPVKRAAAAIMRCDHLGMARRLNRDAADSFRGWRGCGARNWATIVPPRFVGQGCAGWSRDPTTWAFVAVPILSRLHHLLRADVIFLRADVIFGGTRPEIHATRPRDRTAPAQIMRYLRLTSSLRARSCMGP
jgi:hypothetical protein